MQRLPSESTMLHVVNYGLNDAELAVHLRQRSITYTTTTTLSWYDLSVCLSVCHSVPIRVAYNTESSCWTSKAPSVHLIRFQLDKSVIHHRGGGIKLCSVLSPRQHSIGYMGDGFYGSKDPTNSIKVLKEMLQRKKQRTKTTKSQIWRYNKTHKKGYTQNKHNKSPSLH